MAISIAPDRVPGVRADCVPGLRAAPRQGSRRSSATPRTPSARPSRTLMAPSSARTPGPVRKAVVASPASCRTATSGRRLASTSLSCMGPCRLRPTGMLGPHGHWVHGWRMGSLGPLLHVLFLYTVTLPLWQGCDGHSRREDAGQGGHRCRRAYPVLCRRHLVGHAPQESLCPDNALQLPVGQGPAGGVVVRPAGGVVVRLACAYIG